MISITQLLIIINVCMFMQYDIISIYLRKYLIFSPQYFNSIYQIPRLIVPHFGHINVLHLMINMISFIRIGNIMENLLNKYYLITVLNLGILSSIIHIIISYLGIYVYGIYNVYYSYSMGFSSILFGLKYIYYKRLNSLITMFGIEINSSYAIWYDLIISQIMIPNASLMGHLSGIFAGIIINELI